jgi:FixJ family two-component response regulator
MNDVAPVVCLVDDDASIRKSVTRLLESSGFKVDAFSEPEAFLGHLTAHSVPVAVLDIWMDKMTGMVLLAHLCARSPKTRVIFITGREDHAAKTTVMQAGAFAFFVKPFDQNGFLAAVRNAFGHASAEEEELSRRIGTNNSHAYELRPSRQPDTFLSVSECNRECMERAVRPPINARPNQQTRGAEHGCA